MIEIKKRLYTQRLFATSTRWADRFLPVVYTGYRGDLQSVPKYFKVIDGNSCETDLTRSMDELLSLMKSTTRNEIRRAEKEGCVYEYGYDYDTFMPFYNDFAKTKGLPDHVTLSKIAYYGKPVVSMVKYNGEILVMHLTMIDEDNKLALLLNSGSRRFDENISRNLIGWANRYCHYKDLEAMKNMGLVTYDWNGVCLDPEDERYSIGQFKLAFGGAVTNNPCLLSPAFNMMNRIKSSIFNLKNKVRK